MSVTVSLMRTGRRTQSNESRKEKEKLMRKGEIPAGEDDMRKREKKSKNAGFSLVELIVVVAVIAICAGGVGIGINYLTYANSKKAAIKIDTELTEVRLLDMSKSQKTYIYLAADAGGDIYIRRSEDASITSYDGSNAWTKVLGSGRSLDYVVVTGGAVETKKTLDSTKLLRFSFYRNSGVFQPYDVDGYYKTLQVMNGTSTGSSIELIPETGKHYVAVN